MKNFNVKQSGSEVILEEVNPHKRFLFGHQYTVNPNYSTFTPLILTSIDPQIKVGQVIREDQLEIGWDNECQSCGSMNTDLVTKNCLYCNDCHDNSDSKQVAKLKQVQLSDKIGHINCDPEALKDPEFVKAMNQMAELAYNMKKKR